MSVDSTARPGTELAVLGHGFLPAVRGREGNIVNPSDNVVQIAERG
jgi:hypothetical protein